MIFHVYVCSGGPPLPALSPKGIPDEAAEESEEREGDLHLHRQEAGAPGPDRGSKAADLPEGLRQPAGAQRRQPPARLQDQALVPVREPTVPAGHLQGTLPLPLPGSRPPRDVHHLARRGAGGLPAPFPEGEEEHHGRPSFLHVQPLPPFRLGRLCRPILPPTPAVE